MQKKTATRQMLVYLICL